MTSGGDHWIPVQTYSFGDLPPPSEWHLIMATETEARMVSKRTVSILWEYCLVLKFCHIQVTFVKCSGKSKTSTKTIDRTSSHVLHVRYHVDKRNVDRQGEI